MKIILSRKGFDSSRNSGRVPSPIFEDGKMVSLPIPDRQSPIQYQNILWNKYNIGPIVNSLTRGRIKPDFKAHLDPDLNKESLQRHQKWRPILGQEGSAQGHLRNQGINPGDIFLFFGLFREVIKIKSDFQFRKGTSPKHVIWGWMQIDEIIKVDQADHNRLNWAQYHPHFHRKPDIKNTLYIAKKYLEHKLVEREKIHGAGFFKQFSPKLRLTDSKSKKPSTWKLPIWFYPTEGKNPLTFHSNMERWERIDDHITLKTVGRGQEFVFDSAEYPESIDWLANLLDGNTDSPPILSNT